MKANIEKSVSPTEPEQRATISKASNSSSSISDNRSKTQAQRTLQNKANQSTQVNELNAIQLKANQRAKGPSNQVVQRFENIDIARAKGTLFLALMGTETKITQTINAHLKTFQEHPTVDAHRAMMVKINELQNELMNIHEEMVQMVTVYEGAEEAQQNAFFESYLAGKPATYGSDNLNHAQIKDLFNSLSGKTKTADDDVVDLAPDRSRFLMFVLQGLRDNIGLDQYRTLDRNLGDNRQVKINRTGPNNLSGGLEDGDHNAFSKKTDDGNKDADAALFGATDSGLGFLGRKFAIPYNRTANPRRDEIGHVQVNMDRGNMLLPIFTGMKNGNMEMFTGPKKMTVHHEVGHINSMLEGRSGASDTSGPVDARVDRKMTGPLSKLTDQEEMYNIWGGPRSDRAYGEELDLPQRFDHYSMVAYYRDPVSGISGGGNYDEFTHTLKSGHEFTNSTDEMKVKVLARIRMVANASWNTYTKGIWSAPDGVKAIRKLLQIHTITLDRLKTEGQTINTGEGDKRNAVTKSFYEILANLNPDNKANLVESLIELDKLPF